MKHIDHPFIVRTLCAGLSVCALSLPWVATTSHAQTVFSQNFSSSTVVTDYVGTGTNQFSGINSGGTDFNWAIGGGALQGSRTNAKAAGGDSGSANKVGILSLANGAASFGFDFNFTSNAAYPNTTGTNDVIFQVGSGYTATSTGAQSANTYAQFTIDLLNSNQYSVTGTGGAVTLTGSHHFTFDLNNTGGNVTFTTPGGTPLIVANDTFALFYDTTVLATGLPVSATGGTATLDITDFKVRFGVDYGTIGVDNVTVNAVPEPSTYALLGVGLVGVGVVVKRRRTCVS